MAITNQSVLDLARVDLNDAKDAGSDANARYKDTTELMVYLNDFIALTYSVRPDLRFAVEGDFTTPFEDMVVGSDFPLALRYRSLAAAYLVARAEARDDEHTIDQRFTMMFGLATTGMKQT